MSLNRFIEAQKQDYEQALSEIKSGHKSSHWMWYIFPQIKGLGFSSTAQYYAIKDPEEARAYMQTPLLRANLLEISGALLKLDSCNPEVVMGYPDDMKLKSCMTLFEAVEPTESVFGEVLEKFFGGERDQRTLELMQRR
ncbi:MAG: DUF1810 domain-containing protein [Eubacteriales bacterium]|nr:DUF1810 domain-containing protein [Eubacteriales bacterium]